MTYKWSNPHEWLADWIKRASNDQLEWAVTQLANKCDGDQLQDSFQELMSDEGYFAEEEGMISYHFSMGNSTDGPIGLCARVTDRSETKALEKLQERLNAIVGGFKEVELKSGEEYIAVYISTENMSVEMIDESEAAMVAELEAFVESYEEE